MVASAKLEDAVGFVLYELWMLRECAQMPKHADRVLQNLWIEGSVLHARVLRDFFFTKFNKEGIRATYPEDIVAIDYFASPSSWPYTSSHLPQYLRQNKDRMDCALAHLSFDRIKYEQVSKVWKVGSLYSEIYDKWFEFIGKLDQENNSVASWFRKHTRARFVPFSPPV